MTTTVNGFAASPGSAEGVARVVTDVADVGVVAEGEILVAPMTEPRWLPAFARCAAVVTDVGGIMSHAAIICREYGLPAVTGTGDATSLIRSGQRVRVDGSAGVVTVLSVVRPADVEREFTATPIHDDGRPRTESDPVPVHDRLEGLGR